MPQATLAALRALLIYNLLITPYLAWLMVRGAAAKGLAPALLVHAVLTIFLAVAYISAERAERKREAEEAVGLAPETPGNDEPEKKN